MKLNKIDWADYALLSIGIVGILISTRMLSWHERLNVCVYVVLFVHGISFIAKDPASQKQIRKINLLFIIITASFIGLDELLF